MMLGSAVLALALASSAAALAEDIDFGDDSSTWAHDHQCDDPRFEGPGAAILRSPADELRDASDCRQAFEAGEVTLAGTTATVQKIEASDDIDFGDDSGMFAKDGECDDPRFGGTLASHTKADATDCRTAFEAGEVTLAPPLVHTGVVDGIDYGDDSGGYPRDGQCDDPRFTGTNVWHGANESGVLADATDCLAAVKDGTAAFTQPDWAPSSVGVVDGIDFGDDSGNWSRDNACDDPRFIGSGVGVALDDHLMADATDCSVAYLDGTVRLAGETGQSGDFRINFGDDSSRSAYDGVCDDPRFQGRGGALELLEINILSDATDCRAAYEAGTVSYDP